MLEGPSDNVALAGESEHTSTVVEYLRPGPESARANEVAGVESESQPARQRLIADTRTPSRPVLISNSATHRTEEALPQVVRPEAQIVSGAEPMAPSSPEAAR